MDLIETLAWSLRVVREQTLLEVDGLQPEQFFQQEPPGEHHPAWLLGHLLLADSYLLHLLGAEGLPPDFPDVIAAHGPASVPKQDPSRYLPSATLVERLTQTGTQRCEIVRGMTPAELQRATPDPTLAQTQPTIGHHLHSLVFHEGHHGGQLAAWRRRHRLGAARWVFAVDRKTDN